MTSSSFLRIVLGAGVIILLILLALGLFRQAGPEPGPLVRFNPAQFVRERPTLDAPYLSSDYRVVDAMLALAEVRPGDKVVDLGSGDGRILIAAARSHGAGGLGVDIDPDRVREATDNAKAARVSGRVEFRRQDLFETPIADADVLTLYLTQEVNRRLRPRILDQMRPGTRVVSHRYDMGGWRPDQSQRIGASIIHLWIVPARVEGRWSLRSEAGSATLELDQNFQQVSGRIETPRGSSRIEQGRIEGDRISFVAHPGDRRRAFEGRIQGDRIVPLNGDEWEARRSG